MDSVPAKQRKVGPKKFAHWSSLPKRRCRFDLFRRLSSRSVRVTQAGWVACSIVRHYKLPTFKVGYRRFGAGKQSPRPQAVRPRTQTFAAEKN